MKIFCAKRIHPNRREARLGRARSFPKCLDANRGRDFSMAFLTERVLKGYIISNTNRPKSRFMETNSQKIHRIELPVPFPIETTNVYLVDEEPLTIIDTGLKTAQSAQILEDSLRKLGYRIGDIKRILITHGHIDHYGQAKKLSSLSGAEIYIHPLEYQRVRSVAQFRESLASVLIQNGTPRDALNEVIDYMKVAAQTLAEPLEDVCFIDEGDEIWFRTMVFRPLVCPGHSPGLLCFYLEKDGILISGDHLLAEISPNPIIDLSQEGPGPQSTSLKDYLGSMRKIRDLKVSLVLPGHGDPIHDFKGALEKAFHHHDQRLSMVFSIVSSGERTAYEISRVLFPKAKSFQVFLGVSEVLGHLRILLDDGKIVFRSMGGIDYYSAI
jgi:glyoxylase-like metal-dependent hydrolase (beta-lactamase superfamily II)